MEKMELKNRITAKAEAKIFALKVKMMEYDNMRGKQLAVTDSHIDTVIAASLREIEVWTEIMRLNELDY